MSDLERQFGQIDIYLFDQLLRGRIRAGMRVLDAGCGSGRNLVYLLQSGVEVFATDADAGSINHVRQLAATLSPALPEENFRVEPVEHMSFRDGFADVVISSAVLHFARDHDQFSAMLMEMWRVLKPGGSIAVTVSDEYPRVMFTREAVLASDWYAQRLDAKQAAASVARTRPGADRSSGVPAPTRATSASSPRFLSQRLGDRSAPRARDSCSSTSCRTRRAARSRRDSAYAATSPPRLAAPSKATYRTLASSR